jgi:cysteine desulfuration protein SufE
MPDKYKTEDNRVKGCMSQVWVYAYSDTQDSGKLHYYGESDTSIIKGVLALLIELADSRTAENIINLDVDEFFVRLKLDENLSPNRHVGIYAIVDLMKQQAKKVQQRNIKVA